MSVPPHGPAVEEWKGLTLDDCLDIVSIDQRFCGPRNSGNGGYSAGLFARVIDGPAEVTLKAPPPLDAPIKIRNSGDGYTAASGETIVALIRPAQVEFDPLPLPDENDIVAARGAFLSDAGGHHMLPHCFVCGDKREHGDGLRIFSGPAPESPVNADYWTPGADLADEGGLVGPEFLWAALDCPGAFALRNGLRLSLLGRFAVDIKRRPRTGEKLIVAAWRTGEDGRKHYSASALFDAERKLVAAANATWIELNDPKFLERLRQENE